MNNSTNQPVAKPKLSRWVIAGLVFLLVPVVLSCIWGCCAASTNESPILYRRLYPILHHLFSAVIPLLWPLCGALSVTCFFKAFRNPLSRGSWLKRVLVLFAGTCLWFGIIVFLATRIIVVSHCSIKTKTKSMVSALYLAAKQYEATYGVLPAADGPVRDYDRLIAVLAGQSPENTRKISFLAPNAGNVSHPEFKDPWGNDFIVVLSSSGVIHAGTGGIGKTVEASVAVWSKGPNRIDDHGENDKCRWWQWKDDIASWK